MLVLSRKVGERVVIADGVIVQVVDVKRGRVRLGIKAPPDVPVRRAELRDACKLTISERPLVQKRRSSSPRCAHGSAGS